MERETAKKLVAHYFKDDQGLPFVLSDGQADIFNCIFLKPNNRVQVIAPTQYGKSSTIAMALILRSQAMHESFAIVTGSQPKSMIIMEKIIQHVFDHPSLSSMLELDPNEPMDKLRRNRSKEYLNWKGGGGIRTFTADARNRGRVKESLTGFGAPNIIEDEASLIPNDLQAMIMRMLGGHKENFLLKIGNPFYRNHFLRTWTEDGYHKLFIDYIQALQENRYTEEFLNEMRREPFFDVLYECKFPEENEILDGGWRKLFPQSLMDTAYVDTFEPRGTARLGVDVAAGGKDSSVICLRYDNQAKILHRWKDADLMAQIPVILEAMKEYGVDPVHVFIDDTGVGHGLTNRMREMGHDVQPVMLGSSATDSKRFTNQRAERFWQAHEWLEGGGRMMRDSGLDELKLVSYKEDSSSRLRIEPKEEIMEREGVGSPYNADSFILTFSAVTSITSSDFSF
jgi:hypothetical protein